MAMSTKPPVYDNWFVMAAFFAGIVLIVSVAPMLLAHLHGNCQQTNDDSIL
jgi:hypothetical protein